MHRLREVLVRPEPGVAAVVAREDAAVERGGQHGVAPVRMDGDDTDRSDAIEAEIAPGGAAVGGLAIARVEDLGRGRDGCQNLRPLARERGPGLPAVARLPDALPRCRIDDVRVGRCDRERDDSLASNQAARTANPVAAGTPAVAAVDRLEHSADRAGVENLRLPGIDGEGRDRTAVGARAGPPADDLRGRDGRRRRDGCRRGGRGCGRSRSRSGPWRR